MRQWLASAMCLLLLGGFVLSGCGNGGEPSAATPEGGETESIVQPMEEYRQKAAEEITEQNAEEELQKLEEKIEQDVAADQ